eukprot:m.867338 g.867338  ORF g.867338 m.867338 type:complete len:217 (+) comp23554_c5_seq15:336-986(+)
MQRLKQLLSDGFCRTCGATMEQIPCANVGHIYREFNRFSNEQDPLIKGVNIGRVLDRNDARVAKVWMDDYAAIFTHMRFLEGIDTGDTSAREALRNNLQCKSFQWFLDNICINTYIPHNLSVGHTIRAEGTSVCLDVGQDAHSQPSLTACRPPPNLNAKIVRLSVNRKCGSGDHEINHMLCAYDNAFSQRILTELKAQSCLPLNIPHIVHSLDCPR